MDELVKRLSTIGIVLVLALISIIVVPLMPYATPEMNAVNSSVLVAVYTIGILAIREIWRDYD